MPMILSALVLALAASSPGWSQAGDGSASGGFQSDAVGGLDFRNLDREALKKKSETVTLDQSDAAAEDKAEAWRQLANDVPQFADKANQRAAQWDAYAAQQTEAKQKRIRKLALRAPKKEEARPARARIGNIPGATKLRRAKGL